MKKLAILFYSLFIFHYSFSQPPSIQWQKCIGGSDYDVVSSIKQTTDGGYIAAGKTSSNDSLVSGNHGGGDAWVIKLDSNDALQWQKCYGGSLSDLFSYLCQTKDGGYIAVGYTNSSDSGVSGNHGGGGDVWVVKLDYKGSIEWQKCYGGSKYDYAEVIQQTSDSGYIIVGTTYSNDGDVSGVHDTTRGDSWIVKIDSLGKLQWQKCYGGTAVDYGMDVRQTFDGGYIATNYSKSTNGDVTGLHMGGNGSDYWLVKLTNSGVIEWQKCYGGKYAEGVFSGRQTSDGGYILGGYTNSDDGDVSGIHGSPGNHADIWIVKTDAAGSLIHQKCLGGTNEDYDASVIQTSDGSYIVIGEAGSSDGDVTGNHGSLDAWVVKLDTSLNIEWQKCFGGSLEEHTTHIEQTKDGGYIFTSFTNSYDGDVTGNHGGGDAWVVKLSPENVGINNPVSLNEKFSISPNPITSEELSLTYAELTESATVSIFNTDGKEVAGLTPALSKGEGGSQRVLHLKLPELASGIYFVVLQSGEKRMTGRFIKE